MKTFIIAFSLVFSSQNRTPVNADSLAWHKSGEGWIDAMDKRIRDRECLPACYRWLGYPDYLTWYYHGPDGV
jgi:hypothetical protein